MKEICKKLVCCRLFKCTASPRSAWGCLTPTSRCHHACLIPACSLLPAWMLWLLVFMLMKPDAAEQLSTHTKQMGFLLSLPLRLSLKQKTQRRKEEQQRNAIRPLSNSSEVTAVAGEVEDSSSYLSLT